MTQLELFEPSAVQSVTPRQLAAALGLPAPTQEQAAVIAAPPEPALVIAGAGAGKTETMAARVVWLVANGHTTPDQVLGLTFTRKAAQQLAERIRSRLRRLAGTPILDRTDPSGTLRRDVLTGEPTVLTYHAYAGRLVAEHALRLPADPGARLLTETGAWQLAHRAVTGWSAELDLENVPTTVTGWVLALAGQLAEHLADPETLRTQTDQLIGTLLAAPPGPRQRADPEPTIRDMVDKQQRRLQLLPLLARYEELKRADGVLDFGDQMALAARLAERHAEVGALERERFGTVLLDEYQDTGHAQRVLLRALFGSAAGTSLPVTAVGDPCQSIYGWRGASAANLPRFTTDFPRADGAGAATYGLHTSFRNPAEVLEVANAVSEPLRQHPVPVGQLRPLDDVQAGDVRGALLSDVRAEIDWFADAIAEQWSAAADAPPTTAVLVRRRADMSPIAGALRARGLPVEVVGLGGLLDTPEVRDLVSVLRLLVDPLAGTAAVRLLTGARWRFGAADLTALWRRAQQLAITDERGTDSPGTADEVLAALPGSLPGEHAEQAGLVEAVDDPGDEGGYSPEGWARLRAFGTELAALRRRATQPLTDLVADAERTMLLDAESLARPGPVGRAHLDAFADVVADFAAANPTASLAALLDYLATAEEAEDGLEPGDVEVAADRVQVLTVHAAKGLEWQVVAVPHLVGEVFPAGRRSSSWLKTVTELPAALRGDAIDLPKLVLPADGDQKQLAAALKDHDDEFEQRRLGEERRLLYVALTRAERTLLVSAHHWGETGKRPPGPSRFFDELRTAGIQLEHRAEPPGDDEPHPLQSTPRVAMWPIDPLEPRRETVDRAAAMVREAMANPVEPGDDEPDPEGWAREVDVLLAERAAGGRDEYLSLPSHLSVSQLVELASDPTGLATRLRRPLPYRPNPHARRGTAFHAWLERRFGSSRLFDLDELPGAADDGAAPDDELSALQQAFLDSDWAARSPHDVEVPFETIVDGVGLRGRMDAVFADPDGGWTVVDWKTGAVPEETAIATVGIQLAAYRLAWSALSGTPPEWVRAAFHYVRDNVTLRPADLLDADGLVALLRSVPSPADPGA